MIKPTARWPAAYVSVLTATLLFATTGTVNASPGEDNSLVCETVSSIASKKTGVPVSVLSAISLAETGKKTNSVFSSWPWTVNMAGRGIWFKTEAEAREYVKRELGLGRKNFDVGCFQLNYRWHGKAFASIEEMFDPHSNALYAANFLKELFAEKGNWIDAAGAYHSRTPKYANKYKARFGRIHARILGKSPPAPPISRVGDNELPDKDGTIQTKDNSNQFPLLQAQSSDKLSLGSLFPAGSNAESEPFWGGG
jgi:hypothetical protein